FSSSAAGDLRLLPSFPTRRSSDLRPGAPPAPVADAVAASCAIPSFFEPVTIGGVAFVDGGAHSPTNADLLADRELDLVVVSSPRSEEHTSELQSLRHLVCRLLLEK